jgi:hypothetical protein
MNMLEVPENIHPDTLAVVLKATNALLETLSKAQEKHGLDNGWRYPPSGAVDDGRYFVTEQGCVAALGKHLAKGDVLDSMAYLVFLNELTGGAKVKSVADFFSVVNK